MKKKKKKKEKKSENVGTGKLEHGSVHSGSYHFVT
jgi:hypothetical protein